MRRALIFNSGFSLTSGALLALAPGLIADWLGLDAAGWLRLFGIVLLGHAALIPALMTRLGTKTTAKLNLAAIAPYPFLLVALVATGVIDRPVGQALTLVDAGIIAAVAAVLLATLRKPAPLVHPSHA